MRYQVTAKLSAVVTINRTWEIEASSEEEAKRLILTDEADELDEDQFIIIEDELDEIHSSELTPNLEPEDLTATRVG